MIYCTHCVENVDTILDPDSGTTCCINCGRVVEVSCFTSEVEFVKDKFGQSRASGQLIRSSESSFSASRERTIQKARDEIWDIVSQLDIGGGEQTVDQAFRFYEMALDKNFTRGRRTSHVAAACVYMTCRANKKAYLLIDFSDHLSISVYVLGAVFLQLCELLKLSEHPIVQAITDPSLYIHRFTDRLLGRRDEAVARTALQIVASMKRDWMQTGRKPSGLCGAALYISVLSHGLNYTKSDVVTVVHICEATLTKRLIEFENTDSGSLTIEEFLSKADEIDQNLKQSQRPKPGELVCKHKSWEQHFAHGLCKNCYDEFMQISGGLMGGSNPPAFQRAEKQRALESKGLETIEESCVDEIEAEICKIKSDPTQLPASEVNESNGKQIEGVCEFDFQDFEKYDCDGPETLSDIDDGEVDGYLHNEEEQRLKTIIWEEMNKEYLEEQKLKALSQSQTGESKPKRKRTRSAGEKNSVPAESPLEATKQMLKKKTFSSRVNYEALESLYTKDEEKQEKNNENGAGKSKQDQVQDNAFNSVKEFDKETKFNADEDDAYGDEDMEGVHFDPIYDQNYEFDADENKLYAYDDVDFD